MKRKEGEPSESVASAIAAAAARQISQFRTEGDVPENQPLPPWSQHANSARDADDSQPSHTTATEQLEQQLRVQRSKQHQQQVSAELQGGLEPRHVNDSWSSVVPYAPRLDGAWDGGGVGTGSLHHEAAPTAAPREEATARSNPHLPASVMPDWAKPYLFPSSLITQPAPERMEPWNVAGLCQRMEPSSNSYIVPAGGRDSQKSLEPSNASELCQRMEPASNSYIVAAGERESHGDDGRRGCLSDAMPQPLPPFKSFFHPSSRSFANAASGSFSHHGRDNSLNAGSGAPFPFPIINVPFRSTMARPPNTMAASAAQGGSDVNTGIAASSALHGQDPLTAALVWDGPFPISGKEPTFPMKL